MTPLSEEELVIASFLECCKYPRLGVLGQIIESHRAKLLAQSLARRARDGWPEDDDGCAEGDEFGIEPESVGGDAWRA